MHEKKAFLERRRFPRIAKSLPLKLSTENFDAVTQTTNISANGALCESDKFLELFTKLKIILLIPLKENIKEKTTEKVVKVSCEGVVVRAEQIPGTSKYNIAIFFNRISKVAIQKISQYINYYLNR